MAITDDKYQIYKESMQTLYETEQSRKAEELRMRENQRHLLVGKLNEYVAKNL